ncbi:hypothetical protein [Chrysiogenes arsenatis]|uniref:hypothetical protein n=1 Tax=Chrysiogenes arsenatis TaxID=309797 RepID=UPI0004846405|nr:hypothetical protein [Chrysiogenes arsenatis]
MANRLSMQVIVEQVLVGIEEAQKSYQEWTGGSWLWEAPEYLITCSIAKRIAEADGAKYLTLENGSTNALKDAGALGRGKLSHKIREKGRVDILVWWGNGHPRGIIEVKNQIYSKDSYAKDIERIKGFLLRKGNDSSLQFGAFAFYESAVSGSRKTAQQKIDGRIQTIFSRAKEICGDTLSLSLHETDYHEDIQDNAWAAACILIKKISTGTDISEE